jgi:hypothetical protein
MAEQAVDSIQAKQLSQDLNRVGRAVSPVQDEVSMHGSRAAAVSATASLTAVAAHAARSSGSHNNAT